MDKFKPISLQALLALMVLTLGIGGCASGGGGAGAGAAAEEDDEGPAKKELVLFKNGLTSKPFSFYIGSPDNWLGDTVDNVPTAGGKHGNVIVESAQIDAPNDAKKVTFKADSQVYLQSKGKQDYQNYLDADGAMVFDVIVHQAPAAEVKIRIDCSYPCMGPVVATDVFKSLPIGKKATVKFPLGCFAKAGTKFFIVNTPWLVNTPSPFVATFGNIRWVPGAGKDADAVKCVR